MKKYEITLFKNVILGTLCCRTFAFYLYSSKLNETRKILDPNCWWQLNQSPTSQGCHQDNWSPTSISAIQWNQMIVGLWNHLDTLVLRKYIRFVIDMSYWAYNWPLEGEFRPDFSRMKKLDSRKYSFILIQLKLRQHYHIW